MFSEFDRIRREEEGLSVEREANQATGTGVDVHDHVDAAEACRGSEGIITSGTQAV